MTTASLLLSHMPAAKLKLPLLSFMSWVRQGSERFAAITSLASFFDFAPCTVLDVSVVCNIISVFFAYQLVATVYCPLLLTRGLAWYCIVVFQ
jgi:hypothetical protein